MASGIYKWMNSYLNYKYIFFKLFNAKIYYKHAINFNSEHNYI